MSGIWPFGLDIFWKIAEKCRILQIEYGKYKTSKDCTTAAKGIE